MSDLPLPEALIAAATGAVSAERFSSFDRDRALAVLRVTLAFRDESGHRVVVCAEEVEPLIEFVQHKRGCTISYALPTIERIKDPRGDYVCNCGLAAALARVRPEPPACVPEGRVSE